MNPVLQSPHPIASAIRKSRMVRLPSIIALLAASLLTTSCAVYYRTGIGLFYRKAAIPPGQVRSGIPYAGDASEPAQRLNLFLPTGTGWPIVVFVHGGRWDEGSRDLTVGGADIYNNIGRYLATQGIGTAVIGYRLVPSVTWQAQAADVAAAAQWVGAHIGDYGGDARCIFLMGHSAGAQLAVRSALDPAARGSAGEPILPICGVIGVSGAGYDMDDQRTYDLGNDPRFYEQRFGGTPGWRQDASPIRFVRAPRVTALPPFLLIHAGGDTAALKHQSQWLHETLISAGAESALTVVPGESHTRIVLTLSRADKVAGSAIVDFVRRHARSATMRTFGRP